MIIEAPEDPAQLLRICPDDPAYREQMAAEAAFWERPPFSFEAQRDQVDGPVDRYVNRSFTGDPHRRWEDTIAGHGDFRHGLVLGTGEIESETRILQANPRLHLTFVDLSEGPLARREAELGARFPGRIAIRRADLNFVELPPASYDLIVSAGVLHHVINIEFLAWQVNRALTPGGRLFVQDYVGETRVEFTPAKRRLFETIFDRDYRRQGRRPPTVRWRDASDLSPLCCVRSADTLDVLQRFLVEVDCRLSSALVALLMRTSPGDDGDPPAPHSVWAYVRYYLWRRWWPVHQQDWVSAEMLDELAVVGDVATAADLIAPGAAFAVYRRRD